jgi:beta-lactamase superfamily II metal-dependent hydrolase
MLAIHCLPALYGDCFYIKSDDGEFSFFVDCGYKKTYFCEILKLTRRADFIILTHIDEDHILGAIPLIKDVPYKFGLDKVYLNTPDYFKSFDSFGDISVRQAISIDKMLRDKEITKDSLVQGDVIEVSNTCSIDVISPTNQELKVFTEKFLGDKAFDYKETLISSKSSDQESFELLSSRPDSVRTKSADYVNASSIAFILKYENYKVLFLGDSHPSVIVDCLRRRGYSEEKKCYFDYIKLSHHGSISSISMDLISIIRCSKYIISTIGGRSNHKHPSREAIAKIAVNVDRGKDKEIVFFFNYPVGSYSVRNGEIASSDELATHKIKFVHSNILELE